MIRTSEIIALKPNEGLALVGIGTNRTTITTISKSAENYIVITAEKKGDNISKTPAKPFNDVREVQEFVNKQATPDQQTIKITADCPVTPNGVAAILVGTFQSIWEKTR